MREEGILLFECRKVDIWEEDAEKFKKRPEVKLLYKFNSFIYKDIFKDWIVDYVYFFLFYKGDLRMDKD
jgi:hypothetical protein